jgi:DNA-binding transcriptional ArsR family regulator
MGERGGDVELTPDVTFELLSNPRRRYALAYLSRRDQPVSMDELARHIAAWEGDDPVSDIEEEAVDRIQMTLYHNHIPKLTAAGLLERDERNGGQVLESTDKVNQVEAELQMGLDDGPKKHYTT